MNQLYSLFIVLLTALTANAQIPIPAIPAAGNTSICTATPNIGICRPSANTVEGTYWNGVYHRGNNSNHPGVNSLWRYRNMATVGTLTVNVEVTIDALSNAILNNIDDDAAPREACATIANFFEPRISPDQNLNGTSYCLQLPLTTSTGYSQHVSFTNGY